MQIIQKLTKNNFKKFKKYEKFPNNFGLSQYDNKKTMNLRWS